MAVSSPLSSMVTLKVYVKVFAPVVASHNSIVELAMRTSPQIPTEEYDPDHEATKFFLGEFDDLDDMTMRDLEKEIVAEWTRLYGKQLRVYSLYDDKHPEIDISFQKSVAEVFVDRGKARADGHDQAAMVRIIPFPPSLRFEEERLSQDYHGVAYDVSCPPFEPGEAILGSHSPSLFEEDGHQNDLSPCQSTKVQRGVRAPETYDEDGYCLSPRDEFHEYILNSVGGYSREPSSTQLGTPPTSLGSNDSADQELWNAPSGFTAEEQVLQGISKKRTRKRKHSPPGEGPSKRFTNTPEALETRSSPGDGTPNWWKSTPDVPGGGPERFASETFSRSPLSPDSTSPGSQSTAVGGRSTQEPSTPSRQSRMSCPPGKTPEETCERITRYREEQSDVKEIHRRLADPNTEPQSRPLMQRISRAYKVWKANNHETSTIARAELDNLLKEWRSLESSTPASESSLSTISSRITPTPPEIPPSTPSAASTLSPRSRESSPDRWPEVTSSQRARPRTAPQSTSNSHFRRSLAAPGHYHPPPPRNDPGVAGSSLVGSDFIPPFPSPEPVQLREASEARRLDRGSTAESFLSIFADITSEPDDTSRDPDFT
ncbi:uncharacterized protein N7459_005428 [Penicillium hispanicum]|uniref:uncharacterized protein n=1 Tax=Penicillium hispanicum TaxID=1080232 RepID=UPI00253FB897|nr:uncharacterized protein N7459_005428 [Penicillium hispanicum]KAJ5579443.1 hypothetical protein N7459_005428 [Penicillium hispanicum]